MADRNPNGESANRTVLCRTVRRNIIAVQARRTEAITANGSGDIGFLRCSLGTGGARIRKKSRRMCWRWQYGGQAGIGNHFNPTTVKFIEREEYLRNGQKRAVLLEERRMENSGCSCV